MAGGFFRASDVRGVDPLKTGEGMARPEPLWLSGAKISLDKFVVKVFKEFLPSFAIVCGTEAWAPNSCTEPSVAGEGANSVG